MKIEFTDDRIQEYSQGMSFHLKNEGKPIDVSGANGADLLNAKLWLDNDWVNVFRAVGEAPKKAADEHEIEATYPENFPHSAILVKAGMNHSDIVLLNKEQLMEINGIGSKAADAIIEFVKE